CCTPSNRGRPGSASKAARPARAGLRPVAMPRRAPAATMTRSPGIATTACAAIVMIACMRRPGPAIATTACSDTSTTTDGKGASAELSVESRRWRRDFGDEVAHQGLVGERPPHHLARLEPGRAGIDGRAVELHHAFLAGIGIDAGEADRQRWIVI